MGITAAVKDKLEATLPSAETTRTKLLDWKQQTGLQWDQVARLAGRSRVAFERFSKDQYHHTADTDVLIRRSVEDLLQRYPAQPSSRGIGPVYDNENHQAIRAWFNACREHRQIVVIYGPPGSGKTFSLKTLIAEHNREHLRRESPERVFYLRATRRMAPVDVLGRLCAVVGAPRSNRVQGCLTALRYWLREYRVTLAIDEAQGLGLDAMEVLRELHDEEPEAGLILAGSHGLRQFFDRKAGELEQWNSRIDASIALTGVSEEAATSIVRAEMPNAGPRNVSALVANSRVADLHNGGTRYISLRRLTDNIAHRRAALAQKEAQ